MIKKKLVKIGAAGILAAAMVGVSVCSVGAEEIPAGEVVESAEDSVPAETVDVITGLKVTFLTVTGEIVGTDYAQTTSVSQVGDYYVFTLGEDFFLPEGYELMPGVAQTQDVPIPYGVIGQYGMIVRPVEEVVEPTPEPTEEPTPTPEPTEEPTPTPEPTEEPTPTPEPTEEPTPDPTEEPAEPTEEPTKEPTGGAAVTAVPVEEETAERTGAVPTGDATDTLRLVLPISIGAAGVAVLATVKKKAKNAH